MCVKEFYGYNCGHCSVPVLRQCPLSASNPNYPVCKFPAERPIFTNEFCHPCSRVVWNMNVLKNEEEHRARHMQGECSCEVIFDGEDREKRLRTRSCRGKGRGKGKEHARGNQQGDAGVAHGAFENDIAGGNSDPSGCGDDGGVGEGQDNEKFESMENNMPMVRLEEISARGTWEPAAQMAAYEYVGYYMDHSQTQGTDPHQSYAVALGGNQSGQLPMGQVGSGMRWFPHHQQYYQSPQYPSTLAYNAAEDTHRGLRTAPHRVASLPNERYEDHAHTDHIEGPYVLTQPLVVSSEMRRPESI